MTVPPGTYSIRATRRGYQVSMSMAGPPQITVKPGEDLLPLAISLVPAAVISGRIVDERNRPVPRASVEAIGRYSQASAMADDLGRFRIANLSSKWYLIKAKIGEVGLAPEVRTDGTAEVNYGTTYYPNSLSPGAAVQVQAQAGQETSDIVVRLKPAPIVRVSGVVAGVPAGASNIAVHLGPDHGRPGTNGFGKPLYRLAIGSGIAPDPRTNAPTEITTSIALHCRSTLRTNRQSRLDCSTRFKSQWKCHRGTIVRKTG